ncbi:MAG: DUF4330 domain-containing protein [Actinobacteria bacterium]|nr:DUF4330 domain-containing protein [Actinomycetota bacterium]
MAVIDDKGRIFGRINLIDLTLIFSVFVIVALALVVMIKQGKVVTIPEDKVVEYTMIVKAIRPDVAGYIRKGDIVKKQLTQGPIGTVKGSVTEPARIMIDTAGGSRVATTSPTEVDAYITIETKGRVGKDIIATGNEVLRVGDRFNIITKWFIGDAVIIGMDVKDNQS